MTLSLHERVLSSVCVLTVEGEVDLATGSALQARLRSVLAAGCRSVVLDLRGLRFLDCAGITVLLRAARVLALAGGALVLAAVPPRVRAVLDLADVAALLPARGSVLAAVLAAGTGESPVAQVLTGAALADPPRVRRA